MNSLALHEVRLAMGFYAVPCGTCTACCHGDAVRLLPHEDAGHVRVRLGLPSAGVLMRQ